MTRRAGRRIPAEQLALPRENDLPTHWDGARITWEGWKEQIDVQICPPPKKPDTCTRCGSTTPQPVNNGTIWASTAGVTPIRRARIHFPDEVVIGNLVAFRCPDCRTDSVLDMRTGELWDLDETDYLESGSWEP